MPIREFLMELAAQEPHHSGEWEALPWPEEASGSGKQMFRCKTCGRVSYGPDKRCYRSPEEQAPINAEYAAFRATQKPYRP